MLCARAGIWRVLACAARSLCGEGIRARPCVSHICTLSFTINSDVSVFTCTRVNQESVKPLDVIKHFHYFKNIFFKYLQKDNFIHSAACKTHIHFKHVKKNFNDKIKLYSLFIILNIYSKSIFYKKIYNYKCLRIIRALSLKY